MQDNLFEGVSPVAPSEKDEKAEMFKGVEPVAMDTTSEPVLEQESWYQGNWFTRNSVGGRRAFLSGLTLNAYDEIQASLVSTLTDFLPDDVRQERYRGLGKEQIRKRFLETVQGEMAQFKEENPVTSAGLEIAGGIMSPVSKIKTASTGVASIGRAGLESGFDAYMSTQDGQGSASDFVTGAGLGSALQGTLGGLSWLVGKSTARRIEKDLVDPETGDFTPITLAARDASKVEGVAESEMWLHSMYKDVVAPSLGGKVKIKSQERAILFPLKERIEVADKNLSKLKGQAKKEASIAKRKIQKEIATMSANKPLLTPEGDTVDIDKWANTTQAKLIAGLQEKSNMAVKNYGNGVRLKVYSASLPAQSVGSPLSGFNGSAQDAIPKLQEYWDEFGFKVASNKTFNVDLKQFESSVLSRVNKYTTVGREEFDNVVRDVVSEIKGYTNGLRKGNPLMGIKESSLGRIEGYNINSVRSSLGSKIASLGQDGQSATVRAIYTSVKDELDEIMFKGLSDKEKLIFMDDKKAYKNFVILRDSVYAKSKKAGGYGNFDHDDWLNASARNNFKEAIQGTPPFKADMEDWKKFVDSEAEGVKLNSDKLESKIASMKADKVKARINELARDKAEFEKKFNFYKSQKSNRMSNLEKAQQQKLGVDKVEQELAMLTEELDSLNRMKANDSPSWFHTMAATGYLGQVMGNFLKVGGSALGAVGVGRGLGSQTTQLALAGQLPMQKGVQGILSSNVSDVFKVPLAQPTTVEEFVKGALPTTSRILSGQILDEDYKTPQKIQQEGMLFR